MPDDKTAPRHDPDEFLKEITLLLARGLLRHARQNASRHMWPIRQGTVRYEHVVVSAHRRLGYWSYDVGTDAKSHAIGKPRDVLPALVALVVEGGEKFRARTASLRES